MQTKSHIRKTIQQQRQALSTDEQQQAAAALCEQLSKEKCFTNAQHIAFYYAFNGELSVHALLEKAIAEQKQCYLPILDPVKENHLLFAEYQPGDRLISNRYGIPEPQLQQDKLINASQLDIVFTPLVAFDAHGNRLGMGAGYYDRSFAFMTNSHNKKPLLIGIAYEFQQLDALPCDNWDIPLHAVATEQQLYWRT